MAGKQQQPGGQQPAPQLSPQQAQQLQQQAAALGISLSDVGRILRFLADLADNLFSGAAPGGAQQQAP